MRKRREPKGNQSKASTCGTAVGAKQGRAKGNLQKAKYQELKGKYGKPDGTEREKGRKLKSRKPAPEKPL